MAAYEAQVEADALKLVSGFEDHVAELRSIVTNGDLDLSLSDGIINSIVDSPDVKPCGEAGDQAHVACNEQLATMLRSTKHFGAKFREALSLVAMWIDLKIPQIQDGNNFGVHAQLLIKEQVTGYEAKVADWFRQCDEYFEKRAKAASKLVKTPNVADLQQEIRSLDGTMAYGARFFIIQLVNAYTRIADLISKNKRFIENPRNDNSGGMY